MADPVALDGLAGELAELRPLLGRGSGLRYIVEQGILAVVGRV
jgi:hypothetical protein